MNDTRWTPIATRARHSFGQHRTSGACYPTRLDLTQANQIGIMRVLLKAAIEYGWDHVDPVTYPHQMHTHRLRERIDVTEAHLDAKLNPWRSNSAQAQQEPLDSKINRPLGLARAGETLQRSGPD